MRLLKNAIKVLPPSISFRLRGSKSNRDAIGAAVTIKTNLGHQTKRLQAGSGFLSQHSKEIFFGLGEAKGAVDVSIRWPSGFVQSLNGLEPGHRVYVEEGNSSCRTELFRESSWESVKPATREAETLPVAVETWLLAPVNAPGFSMLGVDGITRNLSAFRGHPVFLYLWTAKSPDCELELAALDRVYPSWRVRGNQLIAVNDQAQDAGKVHALVRGRPLSFRYVDRFRRHRRRL